MNLNLNFIPPLDPGFQPAVLVNRSYVAAAKKFGRAVPLVIGLERECGLVSRFETVVLSAADAAAHLPRVDAIGGSSAGVIVDNEIRVASLLRAVPKKDFPRAAAVFKRIQKEWNVPIVVMNDGDVTALAGALSLRKKGMLGIAMGSSEAGGFMDQQGRVLPVGNEGQDARGN